MLLMEKYRVTPGVAKPPHEVVLVPQKLSMM